MAAKVRGPLDVLQESWVAKEKSSKKCGVTHNVYQGEDGTDDNGSSILEKVQASQKSWYDQNAWVRTLNEGAMVLVWLPTSSSALTAQ